MDDKRAQFQCASIIYRASLARKGIFRMLFMHLADSYIVAELDTRIRGVVR